MTGRSILKAALLAVPVVLPAVSQLRVPVDVEARKQAETMVREAQQEGNPAAALRAYRRWLEFYPNEPLVQAEIYRAMSLLLEQSGETDQARTLADAAARLDPELEKRVQTGNPAMRGSNDKIAAIFVAAGQVAQTIQTARDQYRVSHPRVVAPPPMAAQYAFPQQPVGAPGYQPPAAMQPMPGYAPPPQYATMPTQPQAMPQPVPVDAYGNPIPQPIAQSYPQQPQPMPQPAPVDAYGNPIPQPVAQPYPPVTQPVPQVVPQSYPPPQASIPVQGNAIAQGQYAQPIQYPQAQPQPYPAQGVLVAPAAAYPQPYPAPMSPYRAPRGYGRPAGAIRGEAGKPIRVFHDHSRLGDAHYFEAHCGALLVAEGVNLTVTPSAGEAPLVIPSSEILEIRTNIAVGRENGAFHILTKRGLYLHLAPEGATAEEGRRTVDELRRALGVDR
jgi:hypothetical protein